MEFRIRKNLLGQEKIYFRCHSCSTDLSAAAADAGEEIMCPNCSSGFPVPGRKFMDQQKFRRELVEREKKLRAARKEQKRVSYEHAVDSVILSTGDIPGEYKIVDVVFALGDSRQSGSVATSDPFNALKDELKRLAIEKGGDAVINCRFEHRITVIESSYNRAIEFVAYGTLIRRMPFGIRPCDPY